MMPQDSSSRNRATSKANRAGWARPVARRASSSPECRTVSSRDRPSSGSRWAQTSSKARANAGERGVQVPAHAGALGALPGEEERGGAAQGAAGDERRVLLAVGEGAQRVARGGGVRGEDGGPVLEGLPGGDEGAGGVVRVVVGVVGDMLQEPCGLASQGLGAARGHEPGGQGAAGGPVRPSRRPRWSRRRGVGGPGLRLGFRFGRGLEDDVGVGAADAEGGDGGPAGAVAGGGPVGGLGEQADVSGVPVDVCGGPVDVQGARQPAVLKRHHGLDDAGDAGGGLGVAEVGLQGAEQQRPVGRPVLAVGGEEGLGLDGVAEGGAGAVRLDRVHVGGGQAGAREGLFDDALLGGAVGGGEAVGGAVGVDGGTADHGEHGVAVAAGVGEAFHQEQADALGPAGAVGAVGERLAASVGARPRCRLNSNSRPGWPSRRRRRPSRGRTRRCAGTGPPSAGRPGRRSRRCRR